VEPSWRSRGAGSALFGFVRQKALREGIGLLTLSVPAENSRTVRFHERHGFSRAEERDIRRLLGTKADRVLVGPDYYETPDGQRYYLLILSLEARRPE
jgi:ribosomal protein S18 acetylase RimI-like enzyme